MTHDKFEKLPKLAFEQESAKFGERMCSISNKSVVKFKEITHSESESREEKGNLLLDENAEYHPVNEKLENWAFSFNSSCKG